MLQSIRPKRATQPSDGSVDQATGAESLALCLVDNAGEPSPASHSRFVAIISLPQRRLAVLNASLISMQHRRAVPSYLWNARGCEKDCDQFGIQRTRNTKLGVLPSQSENPAQHPRHGHVITNNRRIIASARTSRLTVPVLAQTQLPGCAAQPW
jgi:hypothetical protein